MTSPQSTNHASVKSKIVTKVRMLSSNISLRSSVSILKSDVHSKLEQILFFVFKFIYALINNLSLQS
jgi:hypothetical protein